MQVTGLGNPHLLERVSNTLNEMRLLFKSFDEDSDGFVTKDEFAKVKKWKNKYTMQRCCLGPGALAA